METLNLKNIYVHLPERKQLELFKTVDLTAQHISLLLSKSFTTTGNAWQSGGIFGLLMNKLFSSAMKKETFNYSFESVNKIEISTTEARGMTFNNIMFWTCSPGTANYTNVDCTISVSTEELGSVKSMLKDLIQRVDFSETRGETVV